MDCGEAVRAEIRSLLRGRGHPEPAVSADDALVGTLGLSSVDIFALVPRLNASLGVDPFAGSFPVTELRTVGDLARAYAAAQSPGASAARESDALRASAARARLRRRPAG
jgi:acyl carrier protein